MLRPEQAAKQFLFSARIHPEATEKYNIFMKVEFKNGEIENPNKYVDGSEKYPHRILDMHEKGKEAFWQLRVSENYGKRAEANQRGSGSQIRPRFAWRMWWGGTTYFEDTIHNDVDKGRFDYAWFMVLVGSGWDMELSWLRYSG